MKTVMGTVDKTTGAIVTREVTIDRDEGIRPDTTLEAVAKIQPAMAGGVITAGNARGLAPLGIFRGFSIAAVPSSWS